MEKAHLPLERVFAIIDLLQGVLEPPEFFLQGQREKNLLFLWKALGDSLPASRQTKFCVKTPNPSSATYEISNLEIHNNDKENNILLIIQHNLKGNIRATKIIHRVKEGNFLSHLGCL